MCSCTPEPSHTTPQDVGRVACLLEVVLKGAQLRRGGAPVGGPGAARQQLPLRLLQHVGDQDERVQLQAVPPAQRRRKIGYVASIVHQPLLYARCKDTRSRVNLIFCMMLIYEKRRAVRMLLAYLLGAGPP